MFLDGIIRRRLAALLLPWLRDEPELEVKLGFINSQAVARNLRLNTSVLNELIVDDPARFCFKDVTVESLSIRFSNWSETAFAIEVRGVHVTLSAGDLNEEGYSIKVGKPKDTFLEDMKKRLSMLDPEGSALHGALERILPTSFSRSQFRTSFWNLILKHCRLQMCDIRLQVQFPVLNDLFTCASEMKELNAESQYRTHGCLFRGLCGAIFLPLKKISCTVSGNGFEISFKRGDWINRVLLSTDMFTYIKLDALQLVDFKLWVPKLSLFFSPADLSMYSAIGKLSSIESKPARDGRQLWQLAARKFGHVTSAPRISFHKLVVVVCLWLRYVSAYEHFLSLVGYPSDHFLERSCTEMSNGKWFLSSIKYHWKVICDTEKELPAEAIARARRIARYRAALNVHSVKDTSMESVFTSHFRFLCKIVELLACILKLICNVFHAIVKFLHLRKVLVQDQRNDGDCGTVFEDPYARSCFVLNLGRLVITICQMNECQPSVNEKLESHIGISYSNFLSFCLSIEKLLLVYVQNTCEHSVLLSCGQLKVNSSSSFMEASVGESSSKSYPNSVEGHRMERVDDLKSILWGEPAQSFVFSETSNTVAADDVEGACILILNNILREMWLRWRRACLEFEERDIQYSENPCLLCEIKSSLVYPGLKNQDSGFWKCSLILGKLNLALGFSSLLSLSLLLRQVQDTLSRTEDNVRAMVLSRSPRGVNVQPEISEDSKYKFNGRGMKTAFLRIPEKHVELGIFIAGPHIHISLGKEFDGLNKDINHVVNQDDFHLVFELHNIEVAVWPTSRSDLVSLTGSLGSDDAEKKHLLLKEPQMIDLPKLDNEKYVSEGRVSLDLYLRVNGLDAYVEDLAEKLQSQVEVNLEDLAEKQQSDVLALKPMTVHLSSIRSYLHSFSTAVVAFSAAFCGKAMGITILSYMDELYALFQVVGGLHSAVSHVYHSFDPSGPVPEEYTTQETVLAEPEKEEIIVEGDPLIYVSVLFKIYGTFKLKSVDMVLHVSRRSEHVESSMKIFDALTSRKFAEGGLSDCGIRASVQQTSFEIPCKEQMEVLIDFSGIQSVIFRYQNQIGEHTDQSVLKDLSLQSLDSLYEMSLSTCMITLWLAPPEYASSSDSLSHMVENSTLMTDSEKRTHWLFTNIELSEIVIARCSLKNVLVGAHQLNKLQSSLSVGSEFRTISWRIKGGFVLLETTALAMFVRWLVLYLYCVRNLISVIQSSDQNIKKAEHEEDVTRLDDHFVKDNAQEMPCASRHGKKELLEAFIIDVSQFSLVLVIEDGSGGFREFVLEVDVHLEFELANMRRKLIFDLSRFSIISRVFQESVENKIQIPRFSSVTSINMSCSASGAPAKGLQHRNVIHLDNEASCSRDTIENCASEEFCLSHQNCILKQLGASVAVEKPENVPLHQNQAWLGRGSVSGFDVTISLSEIQMILSTISTFSGLFSNGATSKSNERIWTSGQESDNSMEPMFPNGAIVAIQDVDQHMYITVEEGDNKYNLVGAVHYSLVGERALFRVKYQNQRWKSRVPWFSLISLHAKNDSGEPLRLNYRPGSGFVDISSTNDSGWVLWRALSCKPESYDGDIEWEHYNQLVRGTFYLVNKKNDCAVAFVNGVLEFVRKPGNPFKLKVFTDPSIARDVVKLDSHPMEASETSLQHNAHMGEDSTSLLGKILPCIDITINQISLNIVQLLDTKDIFPLLRGCISNIKIIIHVLSTKTRVISTSSTAIYYFDAQRNSWREFLSPVEICIFYRSSFQIQDPKTSHGVPVHIYCRVGEFNISLTELSLDKLLFVLGKLDLAGPFSLRSSMILDNCCKVENHIGLSLLCHFSNNQSLTIARNQSASVFLRNSDITNQSPEISPFVSVQVAIPGSLTTSPLHLSLLEAQALAWRTRIMSVQDSKVYPGPFVVVDISRKSEDGLSVVVSPLIRIHNETRFSMELRFRRPQQNEDEFASVMLKTGETIDDSIAIFDAVNLSGELKKALTSLSVGNFLFSLRPEFSDGSINSKNSLSVEWSDDFEGGKAVCLSGFLDQLSYRVRKALFVGSMKCSFSTACCILKSNGAHVSSMHFLIQRIGRDVPVIQPDKSRGHLKNSDSPVALQEQKEIFLLPTLKVSNLLYSKIHVLLSERDVCTTNGYNLGSQETISSHSTVDFYVNPAIIFFTITLTDFNTSCKPVNSGDWIKKLLKKKSAVHYLDIDLDFGGGKYFASLRFSRGDRGILEATIFTSYSLKNDTDFSLYLFPPNKKPLSRDEAENFGSSISPELGLLLRPNSFGSWFLKSNKVQLKLLKDSASELLLDLDALSGLTEISLEVNEGSGVKSITKLGVSMGPLLREVDLPSQIVTMVPRYVVLNESEESIIVRQCYLQDDMEGIHINSKQKITLMLQNGISKGREFNIFENFIRKHRNANHDSLKYIRFQLDEPELSWSGPVCIASLGCFFVKFRKQKSNQTTAADTHITEFAAVCVVEKGSSLVLHFQKPPDSSLPYRIENGLRDVAITFYQQGSSEQEVLKSGCSVDYVWDDLTLPHKLVVLINGSLPLREINLDKVRAWKSFYKPWQHRGLASNSGDQRINIGEVTGMEMVKVGFEVYADGLTRVLRICEISSSNKGDSMLKSRAKIQLKVSHLAIHLLECRKQDGDESETSVNSPILIMRLGKINMDSVFTDQHKYNQISLQSLNLEEKWVGAPFAAMLRRHMVDYSEPNDCVLKIVFVLLPASSNVTQVKYSSIALQPVDLNLDEETLMRIAPFWRTSLSESKSQSRQFYFDHFEIHPIKIFANFLPGESYSSYSSAQETLRSLLHSVVKVPFIKNKVVELNGVLVTHALITMRELCIRCARHYSWYGMRAIYIAKGSQLLPPDFVSMFDDLASSSLDIFFDPSRGLRNLPGLTLGTFKFISKCIDGKGFSGTKRYFGDLEKTLRKAGSNVLFAAVTEISDSVLKGAEASGFNGMVSGFHQGILKLAMEPSLLGTALMEGGPDRKIKLDHSPGVDELYIEGYLQAMLDTLYRQEYLRVKVIENQVFLKNLPPNSSLIEEIMDHVKAFLISKALLKGDSSTTSRPLHHLQGERGWKIGPTVLTLCEHLFVSFAIRALRKQANKYIANVKWKRESDDDNQKAVVLAKPKADKYRLKFIWKWGIGKFVLSGIVAYVDGRLCRCIPNPVARRIVSGFLLSFLDNNSKE
ncbi:uncharacterized protein LOC115995020 isoform X1 [Quercus lobata]|uniref:uncharacterized protein LOC115995020 isoform X1 n=1 Tax=Quercus lobata TaxID=97700 RepID=UPI001245B054|nr:uncharacterized protein LOC115995020 isoform X1 [Quercus lobata]